MRRFVLGSILVSLLIMAGCNDIMGFNDRDVISYEEYYHTGDQPGDEGSRNEGFGGESTSGVGGLDEGTRGEPPVNPDGGVDSFDIERVNFECAVPTVNTNDQCPADCTGGCDQNTCVMNCNGISDCQGVKITCPDGMDCLIACGGLSSCGSAQIICPEEGGCDVTCSETSACQGAFLQCPTIGQCSISCNGLSSCQSSIIECRGGACSASCEGEASGLDDFIGAEATCQASSNCPLTGGAR